MRADIASQKCDGAWFSAQSRKCPSDVVSLAAHHLAHRRSPQEIAGTPKRDRQGFVKARIQSDAQDHGSGDHSGKKPDANTQRFDPKSVIPISRRRLARGNRLLPKNVNHANRSAAEHLAVSHRRPAPFEALPDCPVVVPPVVGYVGHGFSCVFFHDEFRTLANWDRPPGECSLYVRSCCAVVALCSGVYQ